MESRILNHHKNGAVTPYNINACDWSYILTPIEMDAWFWILQKGRTPFYPQYPVGKYIIDFGMPHLKIGLELDGKAYHDKDKDYARDKELKSLGWTIIRVTGKEMVRSQPDEIHAFHEMDDIRQASPILNKWLRTTGEGVIQAIKGRYLKQTYPMPEEFIGEYFAMCEASVNEHILLNTYNQ